MTELQQNRYDKLLRRVGGMIGAKSMVNDALGELFPVIEVEKVSLELLKLTDWRLGVGSSEQVALAANNNQVQLFNPVDSNMLVVPTHIWIRSATSQFIRFTFLGTPLTNNVGNILPRDTRDGITGGVFAQVRNVQQVGGLPATGQIFVVGNVGFDFNDQDGLAVLAPGTGLNLSTNAVNSSLQVTFFWRERTAQQSELQF